MYREPIDRKRLWAWLAVAMSAPLAHFSGGSWLALLLLGVICGGILALMPAQSTVTGSKIICGLELVWVVFLLSRLMPLSAQYWPGKKSEYVIPAVLLALGAYGCRKRVSRVAGVLFWVLIILYAPTLIAGGKDIKFQWLAPQSMEASLWLVPVLLLPCCAAFLPVTKGTGKGWYTGIVFFGLLLWLITAGVLSPKAAAQAQTPFRELSRSLTIGAASRFESLLSVAVTLGWFGLGSFLIRCGTVFAKPLGVKENWSPWLIAGSTVLLSWTGVQPNSAFGAVFTLFLWVLVPMLHAKKISKKSEKNP